MRQQIAILLFALLLLSGCTSAPENKSAAPAENIPQTEEAPPADAEQNEDTPAPTEEITIQHYETPLDLGVAPPETMSRETYFSELRNEEFSRTDATKWTYELSMGKYVYTDDFVFMPTLKDDALYFYRSTRKGYDSKQELLEIWEVPNSENMTYYGHTLRRLYGVSPDKTQLIQIDPESGASRTIYQSTGIIKRVWTGRNIIVLAEQVSDECHRVLRMYEPDESTDILIDDLPNFPWTNIVSSDEFLFDWKNPEYERLADEYAGVYWDRELNKNGNNPYPGRGTDAYNDSNFEMDLPQYIYQDYGVRYGWKRYINTLTGQSLTLEHVPNHSPASNYYLSDGTQWEVPQDAEYYSYTPDFWRYLPMDN